MKNNKGITLIALIITIIVMLILVGVTVSVVINSNLIGTAKGAKTNTELAYGEEANMSGVNIAETPYNSVQEYVNTITGNGGTGEDDTTGNDTTGNDTTGGNEETTLVAGAYQAGTTNLVYTWEQLEEYGAVTVTNGVFTTAFDDETGENPASTYINGKDLVLPEEVTTVGAYAFTFCNIKELKSVGSSLRTIASSAYEYTDMTTIRIPEGVTSFDDTLSAPNSYPVTLYLPSTLEALPNGLCGEMITEIYIPITADELDNWRFQDRVFSSVYDESMVNVKVYGTDCYQTITSEGATLYRTSS